MEKIKIAFVIEKFREVNDLAKRFENHVDFEVVGVVNYGLDALHLVELDMDVILVDLYMYRISGIEVMKELKRRKPELNVVMLTEYTYDYDIVEALAAGASGFILKSWQMEEMIVTIKEILKEKIIIPKTLRNPIMDLYIYWQMNHNSPDIILMELLDNMNLSLTEREREIIILLLKKYSNKRIASELYLSLGTVKNYLTSIYKKLDVSTRKEAIILLETGLNNYLLEQKLRSSAIYM